MKGGGAPLDKCVRDPEKECIGSAKAAILEKRIEALEEGAEKSSQFRETFYNWQRKQIERDTRMEGRLEAMDKNIEKLVKWQEGQQEKPGKRWESAVLAAIGVLVGFMLKSIGIF